MSRDPYPAESSGSTYAWQNQVTHRDHYGPSGALELDIYIFILIILNGNLSIAFRPR